MPRGVSRFRGRAAEADKENAEDTSAALAAEFADDALCAKPGGGNGKSKAAPAGKKLGISDELEEMTKKMTMICLEKDKADLLLKERDAQLEQKTAEELRLQGLLEAKELEQKKLLEKVRKLQRMKEFMPSLDISTNGAPVNWKDSKKDNNHVKRPLSAFLLWAKDERVQTRKDNPEATFAEISKILGDKWKTVSDDEKKPYEERFQVEKEVYLKMVGKEKRDVEALKVFHEEQNKKAGVDLLEQYLKYKNDKGTEDEKKKKKKDPNKPKKPSSAFFIFSNEKRPSMLADNMKIPEIGKKLGEEWKNLDEMRRQHYEKMAAEDKLRYGVELEAYKRKQAAESEELEEQSKQQTMINKVQGMQLLRQREQIDLAKKTMKEQKLKKKRAKADADPNKPKKPLTSYILFVMDNRKVIQQEKPNASFSEVTATLAVRWQELPEAEKQMWAEKASIARETYKTAMEEYNKSQASTALAATSQAAAIAAPAATLAAPPPALPSTSQAPAVLSLAV